MGTHAIVAIENLDKTFNATWCYWDGYPEYLGYMLQKYYTDEVTIRTLLRKGHISNLKQTINESNFLTDLYKEETFDIYESVSYEELIRICKKTYSSYLYRFKDNTWTYAETRPIFK